MTLTSFVKWPKFEEYKEMFGDFCKNVEHSNLTARDFFLAQAKTYIMIQNAQSSRIKRVKKRKKAGPRNLASKKGL